jgi:transcriptional regulator with XRE-family HTH domain
MIDIMFIQRVSSAVMNGNELRSKRESLGMTQEELAKELDVTANTIARWERGEVPKSGVLPSWVERILKQIKPKKTSKI